MKRTGKKLLAMLAAISLSVFSGSALMTGAKELTPREYLVQVLGAPTELVDSMRDETVELLYTKAYGENVTFSYDEKTAEMPNASVTLGPPIESSKLKLGTYYLNYSKANNLLDKVKVVCSYDWLKTPAIVDTDTIAINWNANMFSQADNSFRSYCYTWAGADILVSNSTALRAAPQGGMVYDVPLTNGNSVVRTPYGNAEFTLVPAYDIRMNSSVNSNINMDYMHDGNPFGPLVINFSYLGLGVQLEGSTFAYPASMKKLWKPD